MTDSEPFTNEDAAKLSEDIYSVELTMNEMSKALCERLDRIIELLESINEN